MGPLARVFLKLGIIGFGGPAAHIAMMEDEVVTRRGWLTREHFLDLLGATNLIPGPNSTEMAIHVGYVRAGWRGLVTAGLCFVLPAVCITAALAWAYLQYGTLPEAMPLLRGVKPVVLAVIVGALWKLGQKAVKDWRLFMVGLVVAATAFQQGYEILALLGGGLLGMFWRRFQPGQAAAWGAAGLGLVDRAQAAVIQASGPVDPFPIWKLGLFFLKIGAVLYGSGYVLFAFLEGGLVREYGLLTQAQLLDAVAVGQFTPGPVLSTATFIGYVVAGPLGALVATVGIFLPSFFIVAAVNPLIPRLRQSVWVGAFLDGVNVSAVGLMAAVALKLGQATLVDLSAWSMATISFLAMWRWQMGAAWLVLAGAVTGYIIY